MVLKTSSPLPPGGSSCSEKMFVTDIHTLARKVLLVPRVINGSAGFKCELAHSRREFIFCRISWLDSRRHPARIIVPLAHL
jgi:hypothetical protein